MVSLCVLLILVLCWCSVQPLGQMPSIKIGINQRSEKCENKGSQFVSQIVHHPLSLLNHRWLLTHVSYTPSPPTTQHHAASSSLTSRHHDQTHLLLDNSQWPPQHIPPIPPQMITHCPHHPLPRIPKHPILPAPMQQHPIIRHYHQRLRTILPQPIHVPNRRRHRKRHRRMRTILHRQTPIHIERPLQTMHCLPVHGQRLRAQVRRRIQHLL